MEEVKRVLAFQNDESKLQRALKELLLVAAGGSLQGGQNQLAKCDESKLRHALEVLRLEAAGCCLQGDQDQLAKSIGYYCLCDSILRRDELRCYKENPWFQHELLQVQLGMGQVFAAMQIYDLAEAYIFHYAMRSVPHGDSEQDSELLRMAI
eukprot:gene39862-48537_t